MLSTATNSIQAPAHALHEASPAETQDGAANAQPSLPASPEPSSTPIELASCVPMGGLHPVVHKPPTELFGFILDKIREGMQNDTGGKCGLACEGMKLLVDDQGKLHGDPSDTTPL